MPGMKCPECSKGTLFSIPTGKKCSNCGFTVIVIPNKGKGGRGNKCVICGRMTVFNGQCTKCGSKYSSRRKK